MQKFSLKKKRKHVIFVQVVVTILILTVFYFLLMESAGGVHTQEKQILENAVNQDITQCYALEGEYPPDLEYLKEHYGLTYNRSLFIVQYEYIGGNIRPNVTIIERKKRNV